MLDIEQLADGIEFWADRGVRSAGVSHAEERMKPEIVVGAMGIRTPAW